MVSVLYLAIKACPLGIVPQRIILMQSAVESVVVCNMKTIAVANNVCAVVVELMAEASLLVSEDPVQIKPSIFL